MVHKLISWLATPETKEDCKHYEGSDNVHTCCNRSMGESHDKSIPKGKPTKYDKVLKLDWSITFSIQCCIARLCTCFQKKLQWFILCIQGVLQVQTNGTTLGGKSTVRENLTINMMQCNDKKIRSLCTFSAPPFSTYPTLSFTSHLPPPFKMIT